MARKSQARKARKNTTFDDQWLAESLNHTAIKEGPRRKKWSLHDLKNIQPKSEAQRELFESYLGYDNHVVASGFPGTGKAQPLYSKILTPNGWKNMGDIKVGDVVLTPSFNTSIVTGVFPQGIKDIYEINFHDGATTHACKEHLWECFVHREGIKSVPEILSTEQISAIMKEANVSINLVSVDYSTNDVALPLPPYLLGALLGDGGFTQGISFTSRDEFLVDKVHNLLKPYGCVLKKRSDINYSIINLNGKSSKNNEIKNVIRALGLYGRKSIDKFIPEIYLRASYNQKIELLQGLLDTDGTIDHRSGGNITLSTSSIQMANDITQLCWSLGMTCTKTQRIPTYMYNGEKKSGNISFTLHIGNNDRSKLFTLPRKHDMCKPFDERITLRRRFKSITLKEQNEAQCIMIDDEKHLYITDDYIITHNTYLSFWLALNSVLSPECEQDHIIVVRSAVPSRDIGFLPGTEKEKMAPFEVAYKDIVADLIGKASSYDDMCEAGKIKFMPTSFLRGLTWDNAIIIIDEIQNLTWQEIHTVMTRVGKNSRVLVCGDISQNDLLNKRNEETGMGNFLKVAEKMRKFDIVQFHKEDVVRSGFVKDWVIAKEDLAL